ncbi:MAG: Ppx/GppA family phosphatase [Actinomycetota bacterium]|nr:Ppx/GppA family phosphatase [Actinomycetota bacterium]
MERALAVIDIGSNSGRVVVIRIGPGRHLEVLADSRSPLRLARDLGKDSRLGPETVRRTTEAIRDFRSIAEGAGASRIVVVATSAVREADNGEELVEEVRRGSGLEVRIIDGDEEARFAFLGAVHGLDVESGLVVDVGGGSLEVSRFEHREMVRSWTLPLGSLRLSDRFLESDPPDGDEIQALRDHVAETLAGAGIEPLGPDEGVIGTGGTIRNLAKVDRQGTRYPIPRLHGYVLARKRVQDLADLLASRRLSRRRSVPGLNRDRADSIVGGALATLAMLEAAGASRLIVSGQGLREGVALDALSLSPSPAAEAREASVLALVSRFPAWSSERASRRAEIGTALLESLDGEVDAAARERVAHAAVVLDIGRSVDYYRRHVHAADIVTEADLAGFSHRELALLATVIKGAGDEGTRWQDYRPLLTSADGGLVARESAILELADEMEHRLPPGEAPEVICEVRRKSVVLLAPIHDPWRRESLAGRFARAFGKKLVIQAD